VLQPQNLGVLFPNELQTGVTVVRDFTMDPAIAATDSADYFEFQVLQNRPYSFILSGANLPANAQLQLYDTAGNPVSATITQNGEVLSAQPGPGTYVVSVSWASGQVNSGGYQLGISQGTSPDNPPPLTVGPGPASMTILVTRDSTPPITNTAPPTMVLPVPPSNGVALAAGTDLSAVPILFVSLTVPSNALTANSSDIPPLRLTNPPVPGTSVPSSYLASLGAGLVGGVEDSAYSAVVATSRPALAQRPTPRRTGYLLAELSRFEDAGQNSSGWRPTAGNVFALNGNQRGDFFSDRDGFDRGSSFAEKLTSDGQQRMVEDNHERAEMAPSSHEQGSESLLRRALAGLATLAATGLLFFFSPGRARRQDLKPLKEGESHDPAN
jgi:hypothetical protein